MAGRREGIALPPEVERLLSLGDEEVLAECAEQGEDPAQVARDLRDRHERLRGLGGLSQHREQGEEP